MKAKILSTMIVGCVFIANAQENKISPGSQGIQFAEQFYNLPLFKSGTQTYQLSSTDPAEDQFNDNTHWLYKDGDSAAVLADIAGPGCIYRIWSTGNTGDTDRIKIYIDGHPKPDIDLTFNQFHNSPPLSQKPQVGSGGDKFLAWWSYKAIPFEKSCKITREGQFRPFHSITFHTYTEANGLKSWNGSENYTKMEQLWLQPDTDPKPLEGNETFHKPVNIRAGSRQTVWQKKGAGYIAAIKITHYKPEKGLRIKIYWDGEQEPSVDAPVKWFFGSVDNGGDLKALGIGTVRNNGYCYFPMPFWKNARIEIDNQTNSGTDSMEIEIQYNPKTYPEAQSGYFHATVNEQEKPKNKYQCLKTTGRGHVIGMAKRMPKGGHACEGDEIFYIDGRKFPDIYGTGEEDYNNCAWWTNSYNSYPTHGCIGNDCYYRLHYPDMLIYEQSIDMEFETWEPFYITSIVWYYGKSTPSLIKTDSLDIMDPASEKAHDYIIKGQTWTGQRKGTYPGKQVNSDTLSDNGRSFNGFSQFTVKIHEANNGVRLRLRTDNSNFQVANVWIDGQIVNERPWKIAKNRFDALWMDVDFEIPSKYTQGKNKITIKIENSAESRKQWAEYAYEVFSEKPDSLIYH